jgi:hypothetical protein
MTQSENQQDGKTNPGILRVRYREAVSVLFSANADIQGFR